MRVSDIVGHLVELERSGFTGSVTLNFYKGNVSNNIHEETVKKVKEYEHSLNE